MLEKMREHSIGVLITCDCKQMFAADRRDERDACRENGIHWIGVPQGSHKRTRSVQRRRRHNTRSIEPITNLLGSFVRIREQLNEATVPTAFYLKTPTDSQYIDKQFEI